MIDRLKGNAHFPMLPITIAALEARRDAFSAAINAAIGGALGT